jgi:hypothetical protein
MARWPGVEKMTVHAAHLAIVRTDDGTSVDEEWRIIRDGREEWRYYESEDAAIADAFSFYAWPGGYPIIYVGDGAIFCARCVRKMWQDAGDDRTSLESGEIRGDVLGEVPSTGEMCEECSQYIPGCEPHCRECVTELDSENFHGPLFVRDSGDVYLCAKCLAKLTTTGDAWKLAGVNRYQILSSVWFGGGVYSAS